MRSTTNFPKSTRLPPSNLFTEAPVGSNVAICLIAFLITACGLLAYRPAIADGLVESRTITVEAGYDSDKSKTWYLEFQLGLSSGYWIYLAAQNNDVASEDGFKFDSRSYIAGFGSDPDAKFNYDITYENWGNPGLFDTDALRATITWVPGDWAFYIMPQYRQIDLANIDNNDSISFSERGLGAGVRYAGIPDWTLYLEQYEYRFSKDPDFLNDIGVTDNLTYTATSLESGLYDYETVLGISRWLAPANITLQHIRDKSAIDNSIVKTSEAEVDYYVSDAFVPYLRVGRASFRGYSPLWYGNIGLQFTW